MDIVTGLGIAKTSLDLIKGIREGLKKKTLSNEEVLGYFSDLQDRIVDMKTALSDADDENRQLRKQLTSLQELKDDYLFKHNVYFHKDGSGPFCPLCFDVDRRLVRLIRADDRTVFCGYHHQNFGTCGEQYRDPCQSAETNPF